MFSIRSNGRINSWCRSCMREAIRESQTRRREKLRQRLHIELPNQKKCSRCKECKPAEFFGKLAQSSDGLRSYCKPCEVEWAKEKYWRDVEKSRSEAMQKYFLNVHRSRAYGRVAASVRRARITGAGGFHTRQDVLTILKLQKYKCAVCECSVKKEYHVDHIMPLAKGGTSWPWNLQILCPTCNMKKRDHDPIDHAKTIGRLL